MIYQICGDRSWKQVLTGALAIGGAIASPDGALAQLTPDNTLGVEGSRVRPNATVRGEPADLIEGGAVRDANLFHSFEEFNVEEQQRVYFDNPAGIDNIFSRVTGDNSSNILGTLGVDGAANLFLLNPNGILFGPDASLDVQGSFLATTGHGFLFENNEVFSATNPAAPSLLAVSVPLGVQYGANAPGAITVQGSTLRVNEAQSLILVGGEVVLEDASLSVALLEDGQVVGVGEGGRIDIGAVAGAGILELSETNNLLGLGFPENLARADVRLTDTTTLNVQANNGGDLAITARNIDVLEESELLAGITEGLGFPGSQAGDIRLDATGAIRIDQESSLLNLVGSDATGTGGNVEITTDTLQVSNGAFLSASTSGEGNTGTLSISAGVVEVIGSDAEGLPSEISALVYPGATGDAQDLTIDAQRLVVRAGGGISVSTFGVGNAGDLRVQADEIELIGVNSVDGSSSGLFANVNPGAIGTGGNIRIFVASRLSVQGGANLSAATLGEGNTGTLSISAGVVEVIGSDREGNPSGISALVFPGATGDVQGLTIDAQRLVVRAGGQIDVSTFGVGNAGDLRVQADEIELIGVNRRLDRSPSGLFAIVAPGATGTGGDIHILVASRLSIQGGANLSAATLGEGNTGTLSISAGVVEVIGSDAEGLPSGISAQVFPRATGDAQNLTINAQRFVVRDGGQISVSTLGTGNAGGLTVQADEIELIGDNLIDGTPSGLFAIVAPGATGRGGNIRILEASRLSVQGGALLSASTFGEGGAGRLSILAGVVEVIGSDREGNPSGIGAQVSPEATGDAQDLTIDAQRLVVRDGGQISVSTFGNGNAGQLRVQADEIELIGVDPVNGDPSGLFASVNRNATGTDGSINVQTNSLALTNGAAIAANSNQVGTNAGNIDITASGELRITDSDITTSAVGAAGGAIEITAATVELRGDGDIRTNVSSGAGGGGNITVTADSVFAFDDSDILAFADDGRGGDVTLDTTAFFGENYQPAPEGTDPNTLDGNDRVDINASGAVAGVISIPDLSFIQNSLSELPQVPIDPDELLANSCIARNDQRGSFIVTGAGGLPTRPGTAIASPFPTGTVQRIPGESEADASGSGAEEEYRWQPGEPIVEPQGVYQLPNGRLVMSRECS